ncbi:hypothetical protein BCIN_13g00530 [Botrytis cinerea B05.10]|uniref:NmrA-like domain-containing protein n=1 Tax=Botryotinia fuckeliana (strain B05.10) TaxID=332648 RepID=A0A384K0Q1_BOTFB|nr:hypothetical protein BCIN_13g00530 [Botrytis cinerea B05.10]ATZ56204.1 hypothetical protein BCIN_13g00530 [Botrytis cinerea B05.10]
MAPTILIIGATGNTGLPLTTHLSAHLPPQQKILALTRSPTSPSALYLSTLPSVQVLQYSYPEITSAWLLSHEIEKVFISTHTEPTHFSEESQFLIAARDAGVKYVVRMSTTAANVHADTRPYYARSHWAIETLLSAPEFAGAGGLKWTSLQPNGFTNMVLYTAAAYIREYRTTGVVPETLHLIADEEAKVGIIDPADVGVLAAKLLLCSEAEVEKHNGKKYVLNGPEDITGRGIVELVEKYLDGKKVKEVKYRSIGMLDAMIAQTPYSKNVIGSLRHAVEANWNGECSVATTSKEVLEFAAPKGTPEEALKKMLEQ